MKTWVLGVMVASSFLLAPSAHAGVRDVPGLKQVINVGLCIWADAGTISTLAVKGVTVVADTAVRQTAKVISKTLDVVQDCLIYVIDQGTPDNDPNIEHGV